jgi:hypothetical protein
MSAYRLDFLAGVVVSTYLDIDEDKEPRVLRWLDEIPATAEISRAAEAASPTPSA